VVVKRTRAAVLIGASADEIAGALDAAGAARAGFPVERARTLEERSPRRAGSRAQATSSCCRRRARRSTCSPQADERGDRFTALVRSFTEPVHS
jgi:hypothetical protein